MFGYSNFSDLSDVDICTCGREIIDIPPIQLLRLLDLRAKSIQVEPSKIR